MNRFRTTLVRCSVRGPTGTSARARLTPIVYDELHRLAHHYLKGERAGRCPRIPMLRSAMRFAFFASSQAKYFTAYQRRTTCAHKAQQPSSR
jgi:hypothetical protein